MMSMGLLWKKKKLHRLNQRKKMHHETIADLKGLGLGKKEEGNNAFGDIYAYYQDSNDMISSKY